MGTTDYFGAPGPSDWNGTVDGSNPLEGRGTPGPAPPTTGHRGTDLLGLRLRLKQENKPKRP